MARRLVHWSCWPVAIDVQPPVQLKLYRVDMVQCDHNSSILVTAFFNYSSIRDNTVTETRRKEIKTAVF